MDKGMKTRWISLYVENQVGVLSKISGLFSGKSGWEERRNEKSLETAADIYYYK